VFCNGVETCSAAAGGCVPAAVPVDCAGLDTACRRGRCDEAAGACITDAILEPDCDRDGDGIGAEEDLCPYTPPGARPLLPGCAAVDLVRRPAVILDPIKETMRKAADLAASVEQLVGLAAGIGTKTDKLGRAADLIRNGKMCRANELYARLLDGYRRTEQKLSRLVARIAEQALREAERANTDVGDGDTREVDLEVNNLALVEPVYREAVAHAAAAGAQLEALCNAVAGPYTATDMTIAEIDDTAGTMRLADGTVVALPPRRIRRQLAPGTQARVKGSLFGDGTVAGIAVSGTKFGGVTQFLSPFACLELRAVPFQPYLTTPVSQMLKLPLPGYRET